MNRRHVQKLQSPAGRRRHHATKKKTTQSGGVELAWAATSSSGLLPFVASPAQQVLAHRCVTLDVVKPPCAEWWCASHSRLRLHAQWASLAYNLARSSSTPMNMSRYSSLQLASPPCFSSVCHQLAPTWSFNHEPFTSTHVTIDSLKNRCHKFGCRPFSCFWCSLSQTCDFIISCANR